MTFMSTPKVRGFFSLRTEGQERWAAAGFPPLRRIDANDDVDRGGNTAYTFDGDATGEQDRFRRSQTEFQAAKGGSAGGTG